MDKIERGELDTNLGEDIGDKGSVQQDKGEKKRMKIIEIEREDPIMNEIKQLLPEVGKDLSEEEATKLLGKIINRIKLPDHGVEETSVKDTPVLRFNLLVDGEKLTFEISPCICQRGAYYFDAVGGDNLNKAIELELKAKGNL